MFISLWWCLLFFYLIFIYFFFSFLFFSLFYNIGVFTGVMRSPRITEHPTDMTVARNDPVTLKCSADGTPAPTIEWYRDGELIISSNGNGHKSGSNSHRVMLPGGDLFFFRVVHGRKESDAGVYWCLARNPQGSSRSRNATLTVACKSCYSIYLLFVCFLGCCFCCYCYCCRYYRIS